jgi:hypothetical protein
LSCIYDYFSAATTGLAAADIERRRVEQCMERQAKVGEEHRFLTRWRFDAPIERVRAAITDVERYPDWWPGILMNRNKVCQF